MHIQRALQRIADRFKNEKIIDCVTQTGPKPKYINDFKNKVNVDENVTNSSGPVSTIDVQPDYRLPILAINYCITKEYPNMDIKPYPALTPIALMAYNLALLYIFALTNDDVNIRRRKSVYAHELTTSKHLDRIISRLRNLPVPPYMMQIINNLVSGFDERKENLRYVNSLACFDIEYDFGRTPPIIMYLIAHNLIASRPGNANPDEIFAEWANTRIMTAPFPLYVANYLGSHDQVDMYANWFSRVNRTLFNPVTNRTLTVRPTLMRVDTVPQIFDVQTQDINPYIHLLGLDTENMAIIESDLISIASCISETYRNCPTIGSLVKFQKSTAILNHYYSNFPLPTWHHRTPVVKSATQCYSNITSATYAKRIGFKVSAPPTLTKSIPIPAETSLYEPVLYLVKNKKMKASDSCVKFKDFDIYSDIEPDVRHFCPFESSNENIFSNIITGRAIETEELTSCAVPQPNPDNTVMTENCYFLESAIPLSQIVPITGTNGQQYPIVLTQHYPARLPAVRIDILDRAIDRLPIFGEDLHGPVEQGLPGYDPQEFVPHPQYACNSLCYTISEGATETSINAALRKVKAWSSYRYLNIHQNDNVASRNRKMMLVNFRTLHGTNITLVETAHPSVCIPKS